MLFINRDFSIFNLYSDLLFHCEFASMKDISITSCEVHK